MPVASPVKQAARIRAAQCAKNQFSCEWPRLSEKVNEMKRLFNPQQQQQRGQAEEELDTSVVPAIRRDDTAHHGE